MGSVKPTDNTRDTVWVVDDNSQVRETLCLLVKSMKLKAVPFSSAEEFLQHYESDRPACLLLDVRMPGMSGLDLLERLAQEESPIPVIILTGHADIPLAVRALRLGAVDFLEKPFRRQFFVEAVRNAIQHAAETWPAADERADIAARIARLTDTERELIDLVVGGLDYHEIATRLGVGMSTIEANLADLNKKMNAQGTAQLVRMALMVEKRER